MDPLSHVAAGRTLVDAVMGRPAVGRPQIVAAVLGTLSPDVDALVMPLGWDLYLRAHEVGTHSILGTAGCALLTATVIQLFARNACYATLFASAWIGAASHVLLDLLSSARLRPGWPAIDTVVSLPVVAMADPWLFVLCVGGVVSLRIWHHSPGNTARIATAATVIFLLVKSVAGVAAFLAYRSARDASGERVEARVIEAKWASLRAWHVFDRTPHRLRTWRADAAGHAREILSWPLAPETSPVRSSRSLSTVRNFLRVHRLGFAAVIPDGEGGSLVLWSDIRFCWVPSGPNEAALDPVVATPDGRTRIACALWFGGELDADGTPIREVVKIGGLTQTRAIAR